MDPKVHARITTTAQSESDQPCALSLAVTAEMPEQTHSTRAAIFRTCLVPPHLWLAVQARHEGALQTLAGLPDLPQ